VLQQRELRGVGVRAHATAALLYVFLPPPPTPPQWGGLDLNSSNSGCVRLGSGVAPPLGVVKEEVAVLIVLVRRHRRAVGTAVRRVVMMRSRAQSCIFFPSLRVFGACQSLSSG